MSTLYRKYRPQKFSDLIGQEHLTQTLTNEISTGKIAHAYLFSGPRGIGKTTMARLLAKAINCESRKDGDYEPCDECASCKEISAARNIDVIEIDAASNTGVDNVRENIIDNAQFKPTRSKYKVFIIDEVHMLSTSAFNALLKTLEEPPAHVIFVLATTELHKLPATIVSRCQRFNFKKIPEDIMIKKLETMAKGEDVKIDKEVLKRVMAKSDGCMRDAESLLGQIMSLNLKKITAEDATMVLPAANIELALTYLFAIAEQNFSGAVDVIDELIKTGANIEQFALDAIEILRAAMIASAGGSFGLDYLDKDKKKIKELSGLLGRERIIALIDAAIMRRTEIKQSPVPQLPLELLAAEFSDTKHDARNTTLTAPPVTPNIRSEKPRAEIKHETNSVAPAVVEETKPLEVEQVEIAPASETPVTQTSSGTLTIDEAKNIWAEVIVKLMADLPSLIFVLKMANITGTDGDSIELSFPFSFHKEKVEDNKNKKAIETAMMQITGRHIDLICSVKEEQTKTADSDITALATEFGGEVVA
jgi:DNA polymerase-3 subunit gamma/tau